MNVTEVIQQIRSMTKPERDEVLSSLLGEESWREDLVDLLTIEVRRNEVSRPIDEVFKDLGIDE